MKYCKIVTLLFTSFLACSALAQQIQYKGQPAELTITQVSDQTLEIQLASLDENGKATPVPSSEILIDYPKKQLWKGKSISGAKKFTAGNLTVELKSKPLTISIRDKNGKRIQEFSWENDSPDMSFKTDAPVYGLGEGGAQNHLDRRGFLHPMKDGNASFERATHGAYIAVPMLVGADGWSLFVQHPMSRRNMIDLRNGKGLFQPDQENSDIFKIIITAWDDPKDIFTEYQKISGTTPMPPKWAWGYMQSHRTLSGVDEIEWVARNFRERNLPVDALIYLGTGFTPTGWNTGHGSFEFNSVIFDKPNEIVDNLKKQDFKVVLHTYGPPRGLHGSTLDYNPTDSTHIGAYWNQHVPILDSGIDGWWPDGGEGLSSESRLARHRMYWLGSLDQKPNTRPWSLHRTGYSGAHRYGGWIWSGDPDCTWETLKTHIGIGLNHSLSLSPYWGSDIAGFVPTDELTGELYVRWFQFAAFTPSFRGHGRAWHLRLPWGWNQGDIGPPESSIFDSEDKQSVGKGGYPYPDELRNGLVEPITRQFLQLRYQLLSYNYNLSWEAHETNIPPMRAMWLQYPNDPNTAGLSEQYMWGKDMLVAPVYTKGATERKLYLPEGIWYDFWTSELQTGGKEISRQVDLATLPLYVRAGAIIPFDPIRQFTAQVVDEPMTLKIYKGADGNYTLYEDDGISLDYTKGEIKQTQLHWNDSEKTLVIEPDTTSKQLDSPRTFEVQLLPDDVTKMVTYTGKKIEVKF
ncbi:TIM-barrel domain-containing protein [Flagellimonas iocasae]|uniref:TIM-barrel domain-containing protein n=1 Tax=Flagellimonas iocasae TaxID=2055905 RepID=A0ABW4XV47_9FLAO